MDFEEVYKINVNEHTEEKNGLTYLSWSYAWREFKKIYPNAKYEIKRFENNLPYVFDENTGYMVFTSVTVDDLTYEMWLPVMDGANKSMKKEEYTYITKNYGKEVQKTVKSATMFDINKTIMRCLVKNLAMFGLGLYIYAGEDLPEELKEDDDKQVIEQPTINDNMINSIKMICENNNISNDKVKEVLAEYNHKKVQELTILEYKEFIEKIGG